VSSLFLRIFSHLLPRGQTFSLTIDRYLRKFFLGLSEQPALTKTFIDEVYLDLFPETTRELNEWERQFGLPLTNTEDIAAVETGRLLLAAEWKATGGQSPSYLQGVLQAAGFDVYIHEWWSSGPPYVARDPRDYTDQPLIGTWQCTGFDGGGLPLPTQPQCTGYDLVSGTPLATQPQCNRWLANEVHYLVNLDLTRRAPPPIPDDPTKFPYFMYVGGETFGTNATVDITRRAEFERLLLKLRPTHNWIVTLIDYEAVGGITTEDGDTIITEGGDTFAAEG
jgi:hypothetical protein